MIVYNRNDTPGTGVMVYPGVLKTEYRKCLLKRVIDRETFLLTYSAHKETG
jgi:hypothetical protein